MSDHIKSVDSERIRTITIHRPERKNALTQPMYAAITDALTGAQEDSSLRVVIIRGSEGVFTAGNDLDDFAAGDDGDDDAPVVRFLRSLVRLRKPLIAQVDGMAIGVGVTMLLHCDFVYAADHAIFATPFIDLGLVPEAASSLLLPQIIGMRRASEMLLLGERLDAKAAAACGLINACVCADSLEAHVMEVATRLAAKPPAAMLQSRALLRRDEGAADARMSLELPVFMQGLCGPEFEEAVRAFKEKRSPVFD